VLSVVSRFRTLDWGAVDLELSLLYSSVPILLRFENGYKNRKPTKAVFCP